jgi:hypothetical protein
MWNKENNKRDTTVAHIMISRLDKYHAYHVSFPKDISGDLGMEHDWAFAPGPEGANLMVRFPELFQQVCELVDDALECGDIVFLDDGTIIGWEEPVSAYEDTTREVRFARSCY